MYIFCCQFVYDQLAMICRVFPVAVGCKTSHKIAALPLYRKLTLDFDGNIPAVGIVEQIPHENIVLPVELDGDTVDQKFLDEIVHLLGLEDKLKNMPNNLSGGQQQRVAIARALITKPAIVLADEPTGNLDSKTSAEVLGLIKRTSAEFRQTVVMITHNNDIARLADRIVRIEDGKIVE